MNSGFISESKILGPIRQEEWKKVRTDNQPKAQITAQLGLSQGKMTSSSTSNFAPSKNSAFTPYDRHANKSMCIVPKEWKQYPQKTVDVVLQNKLTSHWDAFKKVEGAVVQIGDVSAKLEYHDNRLWLKRYGDHRNKPHPAEYALTYVDKVITQQE